MCVLRHLFEISEEKRRPKFFFFQELPANVRSTVSVALGDLALRFPNVLEPFTSLIYLRYSIYYVY